jgi:RNA polymerase sigma factor (sigma-70 family)
MLAQKGVHRAAEVLLSRHSRWIRRCAQSWSIPGYDADDVYSLALTGAANAIMRFDPSRQTRLVTLLTASINSQCHHEYSRQNRHCRQSPPSQSLSDITDKDLLGGDKSQCNGIRIEDDVLSRIEAHRLWNRLQAAVIGPMSGRNRLILKAIIADEALPDIAKTWGVSVQVVCHIRRQARRPLEMILEQEVRTT